MLRTEADTSNAAAAVNLQAASIHFIEVNCAAAGGVANRPVHKPSRKSRLGSCYRRCREETIAWSSGEGSLCQGLLRLCK